MVRHRGVAVAIGCVLAFIFVGPSLASDPNFESPPVHPLDMSPGGNLLYAVNTADHRLVVFSLLEDPPQKTAEVMVGLEPVTVRVHGTTEAWVVNHLSDSISIIDLLTGNVVRTLLVGDEPTDVVFAAGKAFVCVSQEDLIRVYDLGNLNAAPTDIPIDGSDPRSLALSPDGSTVYVTVHDSGNRTTVVPAATVLALGGLPAPDPPKDSGTPDAPDVGLIVRYNGVAWEDDTGGNWDAGVPYTMPDNDVVEIDAASLTIANIYHDVGTSLFNVAVDPQSGDLFVTNQEALNEVRFEPNLSGRFLQNRVTRIASNGGAVTPHHLNTHINYAVPSGDAGERAMSLSLPLDIAVDANGTNVYVAAFGSSKVGVLDTGGNVTRRINVGNGPAGLAIDENRNRLYVLNHIAGTVSVVDLSDDSSVEVSLGFDPTPANVRDGRALFYDGENSSAHGDLSCASCHLFAGMDNLAWDLGDPTATSTIPPPPGQLPGTPDFHPMKGPMTTQALKGLSGTEPFHWRGDRENLASFRPAFVSLMGRGAELSSGDFQLLEDFIFSVQYPPNPFRELDGSLPASLGSGNPQNGEALYAAGGLVGGINCVDCHALPTGENGVIIPGNLLQEPEGKVVPQLRNMYEKTRFDNTTPSTVRGFGYTHDGAVDDLFSFLDFSGFNFASDQDQHDVESFLLAFDTGTPAAVGAQWTMDGTNEAEGIARLTTLEGLADIDVIGLVAKGRVLGQSRGWVYVGGGMYRPDKDVEADLSQIAMLTMAAGGSEITFTGVVEGCEWRIGVDRDDDGFRDGDELDAGSDPGDPNSTPGVTAAGDRVPRALRSSLWLAGSNPTNDRSVLGFHVGQNGHATLAVYDVRGRRIATLVDDAHHTTGDFVQSWNLRDSHGQKVSSGVYFVRLTVVDGTFFERVTVIK